MQKSTMANRGGHLWVSSLAAAISLVTVQAVHAQQVVEEIAVTGSRLSRSGMVSPTPVTMMSANELGNMAPGQLIEALDQLPQFLNNASPNTANSKADSAGASNLNMRGLGSKRTLVLLDGRRVVPSNRLGAVDINLFPEALLQRVETVTGGASATYGTDAVAGVVNFILDTRFTGFEVKVQAGQTDHNDYDNHEISLAGGLPIGDRFHLTVAADRFESDRLDNYNGRSWATRRGTVTNPEFAANGTGPRLLTRDNVTSVLYTPGGIIDAPGFSLHRYHFQPNGGLEPFELGEFASFSGGQNMVGGDGYNPGGMYDLSVSTPAYPNGTRTGSFVPDVERNSGFLHLDFDASTNLRFYAEALWGKTETNSVGTLPLGHGNYAYTIYQENAFLPESIRQAMQAEGIESFRLDRYHTAADIAQDRFIMENETLSGTVGFDLNLDSGIFAGWQVEGYWQSGKNDNNLDFTGFRHRLKAPVAMDAVFHPVTGEIVCNATLYSDDFNDCVPLNLLGEGRASQGATDYISEAMWVLAELEQDSAEISANGEIHDGWGAGALSLAVGANWREQTIKHTIGPDHLVNQAPLENDPARGVRGIPGVDQGTDDRIEGIDLANYSGSFNVKEVFAETLVPLLADRPLVQQMNASLAARWADYEGSGDIWAYKLGLDWELSNSVRLRGNISRDVRAASLEERFDQQGQAASVDDPVLNNLIYTTFQIRGGNPSVAPEEADTLTLGIVYQPEWLPGFSAALDWYDVEVKEAIDFLGVQEIVDQCFQTGAPTFCNRVTRDAATNRISRVENTFANVDKRLVSGADLELSYTRDIPLLGEIGTLRWRFLGSWLRENATQEEGTPKRDLVGQIGLASALPEYRWTSSVALERGPLNLFVQGRWVDGGVINIDWVEGVDIDNNDIGSAFYADARASYRLDLSTRGEFEAFVHVSNLFDKEPNLIPSWSSFSGTSINTNESLYDVLGRRYTLGVQYRY